MVSSIIDEDNVGKRADIALSQINPNISRSYLKKLFDDGKVSARGRPIKASYKLRAIDKVIIHDDLNSSQKSSDVLDLPVLYEDDDVIVINKPSGVLSHAKGATSNESTVASWLVQYLDKAWVKSSANNRLGIVHRLDRATSGVMICAKNETSLKWLQKQFSQRKVKKDYIAIVHGTPKEHAAIIDNPIERNMVKPKTFRVATSGRQAITEYRVLKASGSFCVLQLSPKTGRTHQLRVHLKALGHPIIGDNLYGINDSFDRLYLHALKLELTLPSKERKSFKADLPTEFNKVVSYNI